MSPGMRRRYGFFVGGLALAVALAATGPAGAADKTPPEFRKSKLKDMKIPDKTHFIDMIGTIVLPDDQGDMNERFNDAPSHIPDRRPLLNPAVEPWLRAMRTDINTFITYYQAHTHNPVPPYNQPPIFILGDPAIDCEVTREDSDQAGHSASTQVLGFLDQPATTRTTTPSAPTTANITLGETKDTGPTKPSHVELLCTNGTLQQIGGKSFLPDGTVDMAATDKTGESEVAFILAHELSHILLGHYRLQETEAKTQKDVNTFFKVGYVAIALANAKYSRVGQTTYVTSTPEASKNLTRLLVGAHIVNELNVAILAPKWQREQERQADIMAVDLINGVNSEKGQVWDPQAATNFFDKVRDYEKAQQKDDNFGAQIALFMAQGLISGNNNGQSGKNLISSLATTVAYQTYLHWRESNVLHLHDYADERMATVREYIHRDEDGDYAMGNSGGGASSSSSSDAASSAAPAPVATTVAAPATPPAKPPLPDHRRLYGAHLWDGESYGKAVAPMIAADRLTREISDDGCDKISPESEAFAAQEQKTGAQTQLENYAMGAYFRCKVQIPQAMPYLRAAAEGGQYYDPYYLLLIQTELPDDPAAAAKDIDVAVVQSASPAQFIPLKVSALAGLKKTDEADALAADCKAKQPVDIGTACMAADGKAYDGSAFPADDGSQTDATKTPTPQPSAIDQLKGFLGGGKKTNSGGS